MCALVILTGMQALDNGRGVDEVSAAYGTNEVRIEFLQLELRVMLVPCLLLHLQSYKKHTCEYIELDKSVLVKNPLPPFISPR
jgi:hypothetical protein